jgi:hypothetical protein
VTVLLIKVELIFILLWSIVSKAIWLGLSKNVKSQNSLYLRKWHGKYWLK